jgi:ADP-ribosylglycohydrolase
LVDIPINTSLDFIRHMSEVCVMQNSNTLREKVLSRAQGCLLGQLAGDALGSLVEFKSPSAILTLYPAGVRELEDGGTWDTIAGQPTDDSEMALLLARMLVKTGTYDPELARKEYQYWLRSDPFDCGMTISEGLRGSLNPNSQANGAMMRISPLGIFGSGFELDQVAEWAMQDAALTHPNKICQQANALFAMGIAHAIQSGCDRHELYRNIRQWAVDMAVEPALLETIDKAASEPPTDYVNQQGWVLIAFQNALYQLLHAPSLEAGVIDTVMGGGDTDTNAAICGALLGAVCGREEIPAQWIDCLQNCRPEAGHPRVRRPRPECFWPGDALELAAELVNSSNKHGSIGLQRP